MKGRKTKASSPSGSGSKSAKSKKPHKFSPHSARGKLVVKDGQKLDQHGRSWPTGSTGNKHGRDRGKRSVPHGDWMAGIKGGKYTEPGRDLK